MSRFFQWLHNVTSSTPVHSHHVRLDLGSVTTRCIIDQQGIIREATAVAVHTRNQTVLNFGQEAAHLLGKTPPMIEVQFPIRQGRVADITATQEFLSAFFRRYLLHDHALSWMPVFNNTITIAASPHLPETHREVLRSHLASLGFRRVRFQSKVRAITQTLQQIYRRNAQMIFVVDIGGMTTELAVFSEGDVVAQKTLAIGGENFTQAVLNTVRKKYHCEIGWPTAEKMKREIGGVVINSEKRLIVVRGRDIVTSLPQTIQVSNHDLLDAFLELADEIVVGLKEMCQEIQPELLTLVLQNEMFFTGGGSALPGFADFLAEKLQTTASVSQLPLDDVIRGLN